MQSLVIVGAGGHGRETLDIVEALNAVEPRYDVVGFVADDADRELLERRGVVLLGGLGALERVDAVCALAIGMPWSRRPVAEKLDAVGRRAATLIHPAATVGGDNQVGEGVLLAAGARVTTNVVLGRHTHLNVNAVVSHDCVLGDFVTVSPGALVNGNVRLEDGVFVGTGAIVVPGVRVGAAARIGAGAVVLADVPAGATAVGVPARCNPDPG